MLRVNQNRVVIVGFAEASKTSDGEWPSQEKSLFGDPVFFRQVLAGSEHGTTQLEAQGKAAGDRLLQPPARSSMDLLVCLESQLRPQTGPIAKLPMEYAAVHNCWKSLRSV